jgi:hypothetical protein
MTKMDSTCAQSYGAAAMHSLPATPGATYSDCAATMTADTAADTATNMATDTATYDNCATTNTTTTANTATMTANTATTSTTNMTTDTATTLTTLTTATEAYPPLAWNDTPKDYPREAAKPPSETYPDSYYYCYDQNQHYQGHDYYNYNGTPNLDDYSKYNKYNEYNKYTQGDSGSYYYNHNHTNHNPDAAENAYGSSLSASCCYPRDPAAYPPGSDLPLDAPIMPPGGGAVYYHNYTAACWWVG